METEQSDTLTEAEHLKEWVLEQRRRIKDGERIPARLGRRYDQDLGDNSYVIDYGSHLFDHDGSVVEHRWPKGVSHDAEIPPDDELQFPVPPEAFRTREWEWHPIFWPLISEREAELAYTRWGGAKRKVARVAMDPRHGHVVTGRTLGEAVERAYAECLNTTPELDKPSQVRAVGQAAELMGRWGFVDIFIDESNAYPESATATPEKSYLIVARRRLIEAHGNLKDYDEFGVPEGTPPRAEFDPERYLPAIAMWDRGAMTHAYESSIMYADNRQVGVMEATVLPADKGYTKQPIHFVSRAKVGMDGLEVAVGTIQLVSDIATTSSIKDYEKVGPIEVVEVIAEMQGRQPLTKSEQVDKALRLLTEDDQFAVWEYAHGFLDEDAQAELRQHQFKGLSQIDLIHRTIGLIKTSRRQRAHVILQIRLLVADLIRDLMSLYAGQYRGTWVTG